MSWRDGSGTADQSSRHGNERRAPLPFASLGVKTRARRISGYVVAVGGVAGLTLALLPFRDDLHPLSKGFCFIAVFVAAYVVRGVRPGLLSSCFRVIAF